MKEKFSEIGNKIVKDLKQSIKDKGHSATKKTENSIRSVATENSITIYANQSLGALVTGRLPTQNKGTEGKTLLQSIKEWISAKGLSLNPYAVAKKIHKFGIKVPNKYNQGKVVSDVINQSLISAIKSEYQKDKMIEYSARLKSEFQKILK